MIALVGIVALIGIIQLSIWRAREMICASFVITPENIEDFKLDKYLAIYAFATKFNRGYGDTKVKECVRKEKTTPNLHIFS